MSYETRYAAAVRERERRRSESPEAVKDRADRERAFARARAEMKRRYPGGPWPEIAEQYLVTLDELVARFLAEERARPAVASPKGGK